MDTPKEPRQSSAVSGNPGFGCLVMALVFLAGMWVGWALDHVSLVLR